MEMHIFQMQIVHQVMYFSGKNYHFVTRRLKGSHWCPLLVDITKKQRKMIQVEIQKTKLQFKPAINKYATIITMLL